MGVDGSSSHSTGTALINCNPLLPSPLRRQAPASPLAMFRLCSNLSKVMRRIWRNPRRAYDKNGCEIAPLTLGNMRALRVRSIEVTCNRYGHEATVNCDHWPDELAVPDVVLYLRCSQCGSKDLRSRG